jgi:hypothetical protein
MSDKDLEIFRNTTVSVTNKPITNENIAKAAQAAVDRSAEYARYIAKMRQTYREIEPAFIKSSWAQYAKANPLYKDQLDDNGRLQLNKVVPFDQWFPKQPQFYKGAK